MFHLSDLCIAEAGFLEETRHRYLQVNKQKQCSSFFLEESFVTYLFPSVLYPCPMCFSIPIANPAVRSTEDHMNEDPDGKSQHYWVAKERFFTKNMPRIGNRNSRLSITSHSHLPRYAVQISYIKIKKSLMPVAQYQNDISSNRKK